MKPARSYANVKRRWYRPVEHECPECHHRLRQVMTLTRRTVITLQGVIKLIHAGYRCPDPQCAGAQRTYRSVEADALALSGMTYGLDVVLLVGRLHLSQHRTVDEIHRELLERLAPLGVRISRREILYLFDAYCTLLRAVSEAKDDQQWLAQVKKNGGIIVSVDGIQPDKGNETIYLVRDALTGRVLSAENVTTSETAVMKTLLAPVVALGVKVLGTITDAQESELLAVEELWPKVPHQVCQFHALRDAAKSAFEADKQVKTAMRKKLQPKVREVRKQLKKQIPTASSKEAEQLAVLDDYAAGILTGLNTDGLEPFKYATVGARLDVWRTQMAKLLTDGTLCELERQCLSEFLQVLSNLRPHLVQCYDRQDFPRTNNDMERSIRRLKTRYRRISGRKNWNAYLLRYGRSAAYYEWWEQDATRRQQLVAQASRLDRAHWRELRRQTTVARHEQLTRFRFRHKRQPLLAGLEERWAAAAPPHSLP